MRYTNPKLLLAFIPMLASLSTFAQIERGTTFLGGRIGFARNATTSGDHMQEDMARTMQFSINPRAGYFISNSFAVGVGIDFNHTNSKSTRTNSNVDYREIHKKDNSYGFSIFGRYTKSVGKRFFLFLDGDVNSGFATSKTSQETILGGVRTYEEMSYKGKFGTYVSAIVRPGIIYFVSPRFGIETSYGSLGYSYAKQKFPGGSGQTQSSSIGLNLSSSSLILGFNYYFKNKPKPKVTSEIDQE